MSQEIEVIYEDKNIAAINKPAGIVVFHEEESAKNSLSFFVAKKFPQMNGVGGERNGAVHRLDKDTSGVVLFAKNEDSLSFLQKEILEKRVKKRYITLVFKNIKKDEGKIDTFIDRSPKKRIKQRAHTNSKIGKRRAVTNFKTLERFEEYSLLDVDIETGRKHQIRCHLAYIGHPVVGDNLYCFKDQKNTPLVKRQFLHAKEIEINLPSKERKSFSTPLPLELSSVLKKLRE